MTLHTAPLLLTLVLFSAGLQVPVGALGRLLRHPKALLAGLVLQLAIPLAVLPLVAFLLRRTPDTDGGSGLLTALILVVAMPVAGGATVWTDKGEDQDDDRGVQHPRMRPGRPAAAAGRPGTTGRPAVPSR